VSQSDLMFVLLQICPQAIGPDDQHDPIEVIAVDASRERLEQHLTAYRERHQLACAESKSSFCGMKTPGNPCTTTRMMRSPASIALAACSFRSPTRYLRSSRLRRALLYLKNAFSAAARCLLSGPVHDLSSAVFWTGTLLRNIDFIGITCTPSPSEPEPEQFRSPIRLAGRSMAG
jgi:hypothetical protein